MAIRPVFIPAYIGHPYRVVDQREIEFTWHAGLATVQKQKSIRSLHDAATERGIAPLLEISSKSETDLGKALSAFSLLYPSANGSLWAVESVFQSSKVFERGGPYWELATESPRDARKDKRLKESGSLVEFRWDGISWPLVLGTAFYDWIYCSSLHRRPELAEKVVEFSGFSDIEFNPRKSVNCQARSCALYTLLYRTGKLKRALSDPEQFKLLYRVESLPGKQGTLEM